MAEPCCAWTSYRHPPRVGREKLALVEAAPEAVRIIAWKAQTRLSTRFRTLVRKGKKPVVAVTAIARELTGFVWAIGQVVLPIAAAAPSGSARCERVGLGDEEPGLTT